MATHLIIIGQSPVRPSHARHLDFAWMVRIRYLNKNSLVPTFPFDCKDVLQVSPCLEVWITTISKKRIGMEDGEARLTSLGMSADSFFFIPNIVEHTTEAG
ncbi:hypothetical protein I315_00470 [Cryptococcus gattii Ru294]|nr:hypothetical protein I315_00470 [Cryptococcus gattii Ru294]